LGYPLDEERLGSAYEFGQGVEQNPAEAKIWYLRAAEQNRKLAEQGDIVAQLALGEPVRIFVGEAVEQRVIRAPA
jgi:TPR repeat protein